MAQQTITTPIALSCTNSATITLPWHVQNTEYNPAQATFRPLVNGEEAFGAIFDAIQAAQHSVDIVCWGFQPSMYFKRGGAGGALSIGELLVQKGMQGCKVRLLCWKDDYHASEWSENNMPGNNLATSIKPYVFDWIARRVSLFSYDYQDKEQREADLAWYRHANLNNVTKGAYMTVGDTVIDSRGNVVGDKRHAFPNLEFATRDFDLPERVEIGWRLWLNGKGGQFDFHTRFMNSIAMAGEPTHHQKMVLVDYEQPDLAVGFVMGHNMLDTYWDRNDHSYQRMPPTQGRNGLHPRHDISSRVTGPILDYLNRNFSEAWDRATGQNLTQARAGVAKKLKLGCYKDDTPVMAQIVRTQSQDGKQDIEKMYLQAINNASNFIFIENQYFRWTPLADKIKDAAKAQISNGRDPGKHGPVYLFVVTNSNDEGVGNGTVNTYRMLDSLGAADQIPGVAREEQQDALSSQLSDAQAQEFIATEDMANSITAQQQSSAQQSYATANAKATTLQQQIRVNEDEKKSPILPAVIPGLKAHICTLVAPDSPQGSTWDYVYIHAKLMIVDDVFTTIGSANINRRSMQADSEMNIFHENASSTAPLRKRLWDQHTRGKGAQENVADAFDQWGRIITQNAQNQKNGGVPYASLVGFVRTSKDRSYAD